MSTTPRPRRNAPLRPAALSLRPPRRAQGARRGAPRGLRRPLDRHPGRPAARRGGRRPLVLGPRTGLPAVDRHARASRGGRPLARPPPGRRRRPPSTSARAWAPRSSWPPCPSGCDLRRPERDTVLYPDIAYPTYEMGAILAGCRPVPVPVDDRWRIDLAAIDPEDAERALCLWVNTPGNPAGGLDDLAAAADLGPAPRRPGLLRRVLRRVHLGRPALHDPPGRHGRRGRRALAVEAVELRRRTGRLLRRRPRARALPAGGAQARRDDGARPGSGRRRRGARRRRPRRGPAPALPGPARAGPARSSPARHRRALPGGGFYLWAPAPGGDAWALTERLAREAGALVSPGEFYGAAGRGHVRVAMVQPDDRLALLTERVGV